MLSLEWPRFTLKRMAVPTDDTKKTEAPPIAVHTPLILPGLVHTLIIMATMYTALPGIRTAALKEANQLSGIS